MDIHKINQDLAARYGRSVLKDEPIFRVVFSDHELEYRKGFHGSDLVESVKLVPKYQYIKDRYILEKLVFIGQQRELVNVSGYSYEPIFVFQDKHGNQLPVEWWAIEFIISNLTGAKRPFQTEKMDLATEEKKKILEENEIYERLSGE